MDKEKIYKHATFLIGETLVDVDKRHISADDACDKIREYLHQMDDKLQQEKTCKRCSQSNFAPSCNRMYCYKYDSYMNLDSTCKFWEEMDE